MDWSQIQIHKENEAEPQLPQGGDWSVLGQKTLSRTQPATFAMCWLSWMIYTVFVRVNNSFCLDGDNLESIYPQYILIVLY